MQSSQSQVNTSTTAASKDIEMQAIGDVDVDFQNGGHGGRGGDDGGDDDLYILVQGNKRSRIRKRTDSSDTHFSNSPPELSTSEFDTLSVDKKLSALFTQNNNTNIKLDKCVAIHDKVKVLESRVNSNATRISHLEYKVLDIEARGRRNNIVFGGIPETSRNENCSTTINEFLVTYLEIDTCPEMPRVHRMGRFDRAKTRPIIANFLDYRDTERVISKAKLLKGTTFSVNRDYPKPIANARRELWSDYKDIRDANPLSKVSIVYPAKIVKDGRVIADKFPDWNLMLYGERSSTQGHAQHTRAYPSRQDQRNPPGHQTVDPDTQLDQNRPVQQTQLGPLSDRNTNTDPPFIRSSRRKSRSPARSGGSRNHAPSRDRVIQMARRTQRSESADSRTSISRPWTANSGVDPAGEGNGSQTGILGH